MNGELAPVDPLQARRIVRQHLECLERSGVPVLKRQPIQTPSPPARQISSVASAPVLAPAAEIKMPKRPATPPAAMLDSMAIAPLPAALPTAARIAGLDVIRQEVAGCTRCEHLAATRQNTVFGVGNPAPRLCFVGEAPGADEDAQGEPFVGRAGQLLTKIIEACTLKREDVYILNVLKCRPPGNRTPEEPEIANCRGYLDRQLELLHPEAICCLGTTAAQTVLRSTQTIGQLRKGVHDYRGTPVYCTYHPSYLLRNPAAKRDVWEDMKVILNRLGIEAPK